MSVTVCEKCGKKYSSEVLFQYHHIVEHTSESFPCGRCPKRFPNLETRLRHLYAHFKTVHCCNLCGELCRSQLLLYVHLTSVHHYCGASVCYLCKKSFAKRGLGDHYAKMHADSVQRLELHAEMFCSLHSPRPFPEESWTLDYMLNWRPEGQQSALEDRVTAAHEMPRGSSVKVTADDYWLIPLLIKLYDLNPVYALKHLDLSQSSTSVYRGLGLDGRKPLDAHLTRLKGTKEFYELLAPLKGTEQLDRLLAHLDGMEQLATPESEPNQTEMNQSRTSKGLDRQNQFGLELKRPDVIPLAWDYGTCSECKISDPISLYEVLPPFDRNFEGTFDTSTPSTLSTPSKLNRCVLCGLRYEDLGSLAADHKPVDIELTEYVDIQSF